MPKTTDTKKYDEPALGHYMPPRKTPDGDTPKVFNPADWIPSRRDRTYNKK